MDTEAIERMLRDASCADDKGRGWFTARSWLGEEFDAERGKLNPNDVLCSYRGGSPEPVCIIDADTPQTRADALLICAAPSVIRGMLGTVRDWKQLAEDRAQRVTELEALVQEQERDHEQLQAAFREQSGELAAVRRKLEAMEGKLRARGIELHDLRAVAQRGLGMLHGGTADMSSLTVYGALAGGVEVAAERNWAEDSGTSEAERADYLREQLRSPKGQAFVAAVVASVKDAKEEK